MSLSAIKTTLKEKPAQIQLGMKVLDDQSALRGQIGRANQEEPIVPRAVSREVATIIQDEIYVWCLYDTASAELMT